MQADRYIDGLHAKLLLVCDTPALLREVDPGILPGILFFHYERHYVFLREASSHVSERFQVLSLLHDRMDIPVRLNEKLRDLLG